MSPGRQETGQGLGARSYCTSDRTNRSQCNSAKTITVLKELFAEYGIPEEIRSGNRPQFASHFFVEFTKDWNIKHSTPSPRNPRSNGQAESIVKVVKGLLTHAKYSRQDPYLTF